MPRYVHELGLALCLSGRGGVHAVTKWPAGVRHVRCTACDRNVVKCGACPQWALLETARQPPPEVDPHDAWRWIGSKKWRCRKCNKKHAQMGGRGYYNHVRLPAEVSDSDSACHADSGDLSGFVVPDGYVADSAPPRKRRRRPTKKRRLRVIYSDSGSDSDSGSGPPRKRRRHSTKKRRRRVLDSDSGSESPRKRRAEQPRAKQSRRRSYKRPRVISSDSESPRAIGSPARC